LKQEQKNTWFFNQVFRFKLRILQIQYA